MNGGRFMFNFRIINLPDGNQVINENLMTPYNALTAAQLVEYQEVDNQLLYMHRMKEQKKKEQKKQYKMLHNILYKLMIILGIVR